MVLNFAILLLPTCVSVHFILFSGFFKVRMDFHDDHGFPQWLTMKINSQKEKMHNMNDKSLATKGN